MGDRDVLDEEAVGNEEGLLLEDREVLDEEILDEGSAEVQAPEGRARVVPARVMVFTTLYCLSLLAMCTDIFLDGTFKVN